METRTEHGKTRAVVNVKLHRWTVTPEQWAELRASYGLGADFGEEYCSGKDNDNWWMSEASQQGVEQAQELARELLAPYLTGKDAGTCYLTGRSGGWLYVEGLPDPDDWDARECIECGHESLEGTTCAECWKEQRSVPYQQRYPGIRAAWDEFERRAREIAADVPYQTAALIALNVYLPEREERLAEDARKAQVEEDAKYIELIASESESDMTEDHLNGIARRIRERN